MYLENGQSRSQNKEYLIIMILLKDIEIFEIFINVIVISDLKR